MSAESSKINKDHKVEAKRWSPPSMSSTGSEVFRSESDQANAAESSIPTAQEIERWQEDARAEGYQHGLQQAQLENAELRQRLLQLVNFFEHPLQALNEEVEQQLSLLAVTLAQQLVRREIRTEPGEIIGLIRESVQLLPASSRKIRIYLHPEDADLVRKTLQLEEHEDEQSWKLIEDPMITRGGCEIKADQSVINATLENRLQALAASVLGGERIEDQANVTGAD